MSEEIILSQIFKDTRIIYDTALKEEHFLSRDNKMLFTALKKCAEYDLEPVPSNIQDVEPELKSIYIVKIMEEYPSPANWKHFEKKILDDYTIRKVNKLNMILKAKLSEKESPEQMIEFIENEIINIVKDSTNSKIKTIKDIMPKYIETIEERYKNKGQIMGLSSPWEMLNNYTLGFRPSKFYIIGARPSQGKTASLVNIATKFISNQIKFGFISSESPAEDILGRMMSNDMQTNMQKLQTGMLSKSELSDFVIVSGRYFKNDHMSICDISNIKLSDLRLIAKQMKVRHKIEALLVDYLTNITNEKAYANKNERVAEISKTLKQIARELEIPVICAAQVNREGDAKPRMKDLAWSGEIEQDADFIMLIHNNDETKFIIDKNRDGPVGEIEMIFKRDQLRFYEKEK